MIFRTFLTALACYALSISNPATATTVTIALESAHDDELGRAFGLTNSGDPAAADKIFSKVLADYEQHAKPDQVYRCAESMEDAAEVSVYAMVGSGKDVTILGPGWCQALFGKGFALIDLNRSREAEPYLARAVEMAPTRPHYINEYAEWFKSQRAWNRSLELFERAWNLVDRSTVGPDRRIAARALRGMGFNHIELGNLDEAERLFRLSKEYDPDNPAADNELRYIADLRAKSGSTT